MNGCQAVNQKVTPFARTSMDFAVDWPLTELLRLHGYAAADLIVRPDKLPLEPTHDRKEKGVH